MGLLRPLPETIKLAEVILPVLYPWIIVVKLVGEAVRMPVVGGLELADIGTVIGPAPAPITRRVFGKVPVPFPRKYTVIAEPK